VKQLAEQWPSTPSLSGGLKRLFDLSEDLRLSDDERVEAGGDPEQVTRHRCIVVCEDMRLEGSARHVVVVAEEGQHFVARVREVSRCDIDLRSVAGREDDGLSGHRSRGKGFDRGAEVAARKIETLPQVDWRRPVAHAEEEEMHLS
jgi:hypothetical protein